MSFHKKTYSENPTAQNSLLKKRWDDFIKANPRNWTPWLIIRYKLQDIGLRPISLFEPHFLSPDIWVESNRVRDNPIIGQENFVHVRICNLGKAPAAPVRVDFFWANPSLGIISENLHPIGTEWTEIDAFQSKVIRCRKPWIPNEVNNGHECIIVNCSNLILDPLQFPFQANLDRHVGQRNFMVTSTAAQSDLQLDVSNPWAVLADTTIVTEIELHEFNFNELSVGQFLDHAINKSNAFKNPERIFDMFHENTPEYFVISQLKKLVKTKTQKYSTEKTKTYKNIITGIISEESEIIKRKNVHEFDNLVTSFKKLDQIMQPDSNTLTLTSITLKPFEVRKLKLQIGDAGFLKKKEILVAHIKQISKGFLVGGYSLIIKP